MSFVSVSPSSNTLSLDNNIFRFASFNTPTLTLQDDPWQGIERLEQNDQLFSIAQLGGRVARTYVFSIPETPSDNSRHLVVIEKYGTPDVKFRLNEALMEKFDSALQLSNQLDIKLIIPIIDQYHWWGGIEEFAKLYGKSKAEFFTDPIVRNGWKMLLNSILNRNNTLTGVLYKNDPAILCWESGNELELPPAEWTIDTANYIKSLDPNHLIMDGSYGSWSDEVLQNPNISIVSNHYYPGLKQYFVEDFVGIVVSAAVFISLMAFWIFKFFYPKRNWINLGSIKKAKWANVTLIALSVLSFVSTVLCSLFPVLWRTDGIAVSMARDASRVKDKVFIVGEVGLFSTRILQTGLNSFASLPEFSNVAGILVWSLRGHSKDGGFYTHAETLPGYFSYHYPGLPSSNVGFGGDEVSIISMMKETTEKMNSTRIKYAPDSPNLINVATNGTNKISFSWFGCSGCASYTIYLNNQTILSGLLDNYPSGKLIYAYIYDEKLPENSTLSIQGFGDFGATVQNSYKI